jgi:hypothetical protein
MNISAQNLLKVFHDARKYRIRGGGGGPKIHGIVKKNVFKKYLYNSETSLVPFEVLPLRTDAAIPAPLPMLETLSKIFNGNAVKSRQRFAGSP